MKVLIIEDEAPAFRKLQKNLEEIDAGIEIVDVIDSVDDSIKWLNNHSHPDLIFMDIQLSDGLSFEIFEKVEITKPIIFTTAFDEYILKAFKVNSIDYLLKPIKKDDLEASLNKYKKIKEEFSERGNNQIDIQSVLEHVNAATKKFKKRLLSRHGDKLISINTDDCISFHIHNGVIYATTFENKKYILDGTLDDLQNELDPELFYRANRQYLIHYTGIDTVSKYFKGKLLIELKCQSEDQIIVSAEKSSDFKHWFGNI